MSLLVDDQATAEPDRASDSSDGVVGELVLDRWIGALWREQGTDLIVASSIAPRIRVDRQLRSLDEPPPGESGLYSVLQATLSARLLQQLEREQDVDFSFSWRSRARLRGNAFYQRGELTLAMRIIPLRIPSFEELGVPAVVRSLADRERGLVLVTGPTGSGKSTTLAALIDWINRERALHILTLEDPIEYVHEHVRSVVSQREIGVDAGSFAGALRAAFREDPDVLMIGEMRDLETIQIALTMAETGHLVFATLHTNDAVQAIDRIVDVFPGDAQAQIRIQLSASLSGIVAQRMLPRLDGGLVAAFEVLLANDAVRNLIREGRSNQLRNVMMTSQQEGMQTLEASLGSLVAAGIATTNDALRVTGRTSDFERALEARLQATRGMSR